MNNSQFRDGEEIPKSRFIDPLKSVVIKAFLWLLCTKCLKGVDQ